MKPYNKYSYYEPRKTTKTTQVLVFLIKQPAGSIWQTKNTNSIKPIWPFKCA